MVVVLEGAEMMMRVTYFTSHQDQMILYSHPRHLVVMLQINRHFLTTSIVQNWLSTLAVSRSATATHLDGRRSLICQSSRNYQDSCQTIERCCSSISRTWVLCSILTGLQWSGPATKFQHSIDDFDHVLALANVFR